MTKTGDAFIYKHMTGIIDNIMEGYPVVLTTEDGTTITITYEGEAADKPFKVTLKKRATQAKAFLSIAFLSIETMEFYLGRFNYTDIKF